MRQVATAYTSANVSLTIGGTLLTNVFGISYELSQNKRPIYGYNSMHWNAVAMGQVLVMGQIFVNFQHPNFLSAVIQKYYSEKNSGIVGEEALDKTNIRRDQQGLNLITAYNGNARISQDLLNAIYNDPNLSANPGKMFSRGRYFSREQDDQLIINPMGAGNNASIVSRNLMSGEKRAKNARYARPDQFSGQGGLKDQLDIIITYGDPNLTGNSELSGVVPYMPSSSIVLRDVHFLGESQQVMADDQPIMEVYKFIARKKETLIPTRDSRIVISAPATATASAPAVAATGDAASSDTGATQNAGTATDVNPAPAAAVEPAAAAKEGEAGGAAATGGQATNTDPAPAAEVKPDEAAKEESPKAGDQPRVEGTPANDPSKNATLSDLNLAILAETDDRALLAYARAREQYGATLFNADVSKKLIDTYLRLKQYDKIDKEVAFVLQSSPASEAANKEWAKNTLAIADAAQERDLAKANPVRPTGDQVRDLERARNAKYDQNLQRANAAIQANDFVGAARLYSSMNDMRPSLETSLLAAQYFTRGGAWIKAYDAVQTLRMQINLNSWQMPYAQRQVLLAAADELNAAITVGSEKDAGLLMSDPGNASE
jgi:hypothetical protein